MGQIFLSHYEQVLPDGRRVMRRPGDEAADLADELERLVRCGAVGDPPAAPAASRDVEHDEHDEHTADDGASTVGVPENEGGRPRKTATLEVWQNYARSVGVDPAGMSKADLIAAV